MRSHSVSPSEKDPNADTTLSIVSDPSIFSLFDELKPTHPHHFCCFDTRNEIFLCFLAVIYRCYNGVVQIESFSGRIWIVNFCIHFRVTHVDQILSWGLFMFYYYDLI